MAHTNGTRTAQVITVGVACFAYASPSYAYLDPGTGSIILQSALAGIAVAMGLLRLYWYRFKAFISTLAEDSRDEAGEAEQAQDSHAHNDL
ncbi:MAG: hypothetical protein IIA11_03225 [Proteobacteria bacterium]|nr:hypothetical protein [Pseudomonadota bacterium]